MKQTEDPFVDNKSDFRTDFYKTLDGGSQHDISFKDQVQVIKEEEVQSGLITWDDYADLFRLAAGGFNGIIMIVVFHIIINACVTGVSLFLAFELTTKFDTDNILTAEEK